MQASSCRQGRAWSHHGESGLKGGARLNNNWPLQPVEVPVSGEVPEPVQLEARARGKTHESGQVTHAQEIGGGRPPSNLCPSLKSEDAPCATAVQMSTERMGRGVFGDGRSVFPRAPGEAVGLSSTVEAAIISSTSTGRICSRSRKKTEMLHSGALVSTPDCVSKTHCNSIRAVGIPSRVFTRLFDPISQPKIPVCKCHC